MADPTQNPLDSSQDQSSQGQQNPQKVVKVGDDLIAFPGHFDDDRINNAIKAFRAQQPKQPTAQQVHTRATNPHFAPMQTESSEKARQTTAAKPLSSVVAPLDQAVAPSGDAESITPSSVIFGHPVEETKGLLAPIEQGIVHPWDTLKSMWDQASAALPAYKNVNGIPMPVPNTEATKQAMDLGEMAAKHPEYMQGMFGSMVLEPSVSGIHSEIAVPTGVRGHQVFSNGIGDVRLGQDGNAAVFLGPKAWDTFMQNMFPNEDHSKIPGVSIRTNDALQGMFNSNAAPTPEWLQTQHLISKAHDLASNQNSIAFVKNRPGVEFNVLPEETFHSSYQRALANSGLLRSHLPEESFKAVAATVPDATRNVLAKEGYDVNDPALLTIETAAKYVTGDLNGATPEQAHQFLNNYFQEVQKAHGPQALDRLEQTRASLAQMQGQINAEHQFWNQRANRPSPQPSVPSVAAGPTASVPTQQPAAANAVPEPVFQRAAAVEPPQDTAFKREQLQREANFNDPNNWIAAGARELAAREGRTLNPQPYSPIDFRNQEIADAYQAMQHNPNDPRVKASYDAMKRDIDKQWDYATNEMGIKFTPSKENPYPNSQEMVNDVKNNRHLAFYQGGDMPADHPLAQVDPKTGFTYNDKLRAIHDLFGHAMEGFQFGPRGEENAWMAHSQMFSPEALPAVTTETKGQNSWVNAGPHLRDAQGNLIQPGQPGYIAPPDRPFAEQKAGLLPERFHYRNDAPISFISPNTMDLSLSQAQQRLNSVIQKRFAGAARDLASQLGLQPSVRSALGSWEGGAENSVIHQFPVGTNPDAVRYYNSILGKLGYQYSTGSFFPGEGADSMYTFWVGGKGTSDVARTLLDHGIENSTIEPAEGGHAVYLIGSGDDFRAKVDQVAKALGHTGEIEEYGGTAEFPGNSTSRDAASRDFSSAAEALESKHPEWKQIREGFESRPDINSLRSLIESTKEPVDPQTGVVHYSNTPGITELDPAYYGQNPTHDVSGLPVDRPDFRRKQSFPNYWNPETYTGDETNPAFRQAAAERFAARGYTYKGAVPTQGIYDLAKDPDHIIDLARKELEARNYKKLGVRLQPSDAEVNAYAIKRLKDLGYSGRRDVNGLIASWDKIPVENANVPPAEDIGHYLEHEDALFRREPVKTWEDVRKYLTPDEKARYNTDEKRDKIVDAVNSMPSPTEWDAAVKAGISGKLWYERSSRAFDALVESQPDMFRKNDKEKFLNFVAALSPVQPVRQNLLMAVNLWDKWNKAGRPVDVVWKDPENFSGIANKNSSLFRILNGGRNTYGVDLPARMQNAIRALQDQPLSGPKVSAFAPNLGTDTMKSTNDTWMALFGDTDPNRINQPHLYDAMSSMVREAGKKNGIPPRQAQAAIWSFIKSLAEIAGWGKDNWKPPTEIIKQGFLTPDLINKHAADFADMLANDPEIRGRIQAIGGDLNALDRKLGKYVPERPDQGSTANVDPRLLNAAKRLEAARTNAKLQAHLERKVDTPSLLDTSFDPVLFKREAQPDIPPGEEAPELRQDNPAVWGGEQGQRWLEGKKRDSDAAGKTWWGAPNRIGTVTGYFDNHDKVMMPVKELAKIPGYNGEHLPGHSRQNALDWLTNNFKQTGRLPQAGGRDYAPFIMVDQNGKPWVNEGNHRIMAAQKAGMEYLPTEIRYFNGGESVPGPLSPDKVQQYHNDAVKQGYTRDDYTPDSPKFLKQQADALFKREGDRRKNDALRKKISEMTPDEMRRMLLHSDVVDLPNGRSFDEAERDHPAPAVAMSDADGLKAFNDKFGYEAGNELLKAKAEALKQAGLEAYHEKGDEFLYRGQSPEDLTNKLEKARDILRNTVFDVTLDDGSKVKLKGVDFSYGVGHDLNEAEQGQHTHKAVREARGERGPRGQLGSITQVEGEDQVNQSPQALADLKAEAEARKPDAAFKRDSGTDIDKLKIIDPKMSLGMPNAAALVTKDGNVSFGKWHENLATALGYEPKNWENEFMADGGIRVRANKGEISMKFGSDNSQTLDNLRNSINAVKGNKVRVEYFQNDRMKYHWSGTKNDVLQKLDEFEGNHGGGGATYSSAVQYYRDAAFKRENPFYLKSEKVIDDKMKGPMPTGDVRRMLENNGIKADEMKWTGLDDLLQGDKKITPQEIKDHLAQNAIQIGEKSYGGSSDTEIRQGTKGRWYLLQDGVPVDVFQSEYAAKDALRDINKKKETRYEKYTEPGGSHYRELLLTLPDRRAGKIAYRNSAGEPVYENDEIYESPHWQEPNIIAHVRMNDRIAPDGKKLLHIEELQSDWHQKGRKEGYVDSDALDKLEQEIRDARAAQAKAKETYHAASVGPNKESAEADFKNAFDKANRLEAQYNRLQTHGVPDAPFKKDWHEMTLRRMLQYAAQNGYDGVSWTGGDRQAARYDLSKHADTVKYDPANKLFVAQKNGVSLVRKEDVGPDDLPDIVGKDVARKLLETNTDSTAWKHSLSGQDLKIGGEGMHGFYDKIVPDYLNKFGKKFGAQVQEGKASVGTQARNDRYEYTGPELTQPEISKIYLEIKDGKRDNPSLAEGTNFVNRSHLAPTLVQIAGEMGKGMSYHDAVASVLANNKHLIENFAKEMGGSARQKTHQFMKSQYIPITPAMRQSLTTEGVPLFKRGQSVPKLDELKAEAARRAPVGAMVGAAAAAAGGKPGTQQNQ